MGDLLLNWLNDEIQLSKRITNFEEDFHNGFLFGELLAKYSQQLNFHQFIDKDDKTSRVKNFSLLLDTFSSLKVTYDSNIAMKVINKQLGVAKKLLYELKTQLEKTNANAFSKTNRMTKTLSPLKKIQISKQKFDSVNKEHFIKQLNEMHPAQKEIIQDQLLSKFQDFHTTTLLKAAHADQKDRQARLLLRTKFNQQQRENLKKSEEFRKQWEAQNTEKWAVNMAIRQTQVAKDEHFKSKIQFEKSQYKTMSEMNALKSLDSDIAEFERKNLGKIHNDSDDDNLPPEKEEPKMAKQPSQSLQRTSPHLNQLINLRMREQGQKRMGVAETQKRRHQRQKRRRKMIVQQQKRYQMIEINRRQRIIISTIEQISRQEKEIQYEIWRAWENKNIIIDNKVLNLEKNKEKEETREINAKFKQDEMIKILREEHAEDVNQALKETIKLERKNQVGQRKQTYRLCQNMIKELLNITEDMYVSCQERNRNSINDKELQAELIKFINGTAPEQEHQVRLKHYIEGTHEWGFPIIRPQEEVPTEPTEDNSLPNEAVNNHYLGNILRTIFEQLYSPSRPNESINVHQNLIISIVGLDYARKHFLSQSIKDKHSFNVVYIDKLIQQKLKDYESLMANNVEISKDTQQLVNCCFSGKQLPDHLIIQLVKEELQKNEKNILVDYPNTYAQAIALCKAMGNVEPYDMESPNQLKNKIIQYERLVKGTSPKILQRRIKGCGIDFVWWIDVSTQNSLDRMLGRRWIGSEEVHIKDEVNPYQLQQREKGSALVMNNHFKAKNKNKIKSWFQLFGTQIGKEEGRVTKQCWQQIDGNCEKSLIQQVIQSKVDEVLTIKQQQKEWVELMEQEKKKKEEEKAELQKNKEQIKLKCVKSEHQDVKKQLTQALSKVSPSREFLTQLADLWNKIQSSTINSLNRTFQNLEEQEITQRKHIADVKKNFIALLTREDHKFHLIKDFQINYNDFIAQNQDMLAYDYTKQELHQRVEDLQNDLLDVVEQKKEDAVAERNAVINSGWLEAQYDIISECLYVLVQTELNRYALSEKLIADFYSKRYMTSTKAYEPLNAELNLQTINSLEIYKDGSCSRLQKLIAQALRIFNREDQVVDDKNKKGGKGAPPKKDDKKGGKKGKDEVEENKEPTAQQLELKKAINTEKAIFRQRLNKIKTLGSSKIKSTFDSANKLYTDLQDLFVYTEKIEKKSIAGLGSIFRKSIQSQQKIQFQVQMNNVEVIQTQKIRNFEKEKPVISPANENFSQEHFTLSNLYQIIKIIRDQSQGHKISTKKLIVILQKITSQLELRKLLPSTWKSITPSQIQSFVHILDRQNRAFVDLVRLFVFIIMSGYTLPKPQDIQQYTLELTNYSSLKETTLDKFVQIKAWFDQPVEQIQNVRPFLRNKYVKEVLFSVFKSASESMDIGWFLSTITLEELKNERAVQSCTYFDFGFR